VVAIVCDPLREKNTRPFGKIIRNALEAHKVIVMKNGLLN